ncbi:hypothetical protein ACJX0J_020191, partial [Zea mays]
MINTLNNDMHSNKWKNMGDLQSKMGFHNVMHHFFLYITHMIKHYCEFYPRHTYDLYLVLSLNLYSIIRDNGTDDNTKNYIYILSGTKIQVHHLFHHYLFTFNKQLTLFFPVALRTTCAWFPMIDVNYFQILPGLE